MALIPGMTRRKLLRLHSIRVALVGGLLSGGLLIWPALADHIPIQAYCAGGVLLSIAFAYARVTHQPGVSDAD